jgi:hypothetical protein
MDAITPHLGPAERKARRSHLDQHIGRSAMRVPTAFRAVAREVFGTGAVSKKHAFQIMEELRSRTTSRACSAGPRRPFRSPSGGPAGWCGGAAFAAGPGVSPLLH